MSVSTMMTIAHRDTAPIDARIKGILARGKVVCFTNRFTGTVKHVDRWNPDDMGDLTACYSTGGTKFVCPYAVEYDITELPKGGGRPRRKS